MLKRNHITSFFTLLIALLVAAPAAFAQQTPYNGTPASLPGLVNFENYDEGGQGVAYNDVSPANEGGAYRPNEGVDIEAATDPDGESSNGFDVGYTAANEWLEYTVDVDTTGTYAFTIRAAGGAGTFHLEVDGTDVTGRQEIPASGGFQDWQDVVVRDVDLTAGEHVLRFQIESPGYNLNYLTAGAPPPPPPPPPPSATLYVLEGASPTTAGALSLSEGDGAVAESMITRADPNDSLAYRLENVTATYNDSSSTEFLTWIDANTTGGQAAEAVVSYDFDGDGTFDRQEIYNYGATDDLDGYQEYSTATTSLFGLEPGMEADYADLNGGTIEFRMRKVFGGAPVDLRTSATKQEGQQSTLTVPYSGGTLPVELTSFEGVATGGGALLSWQTASETNNAGFAVQQQTTGGWQRIGYVNGAGTTTEAQRYQYRVADLDAGRHVFRLRQVDRDGGASFSDPVTVDVVLNAGVRLSPIAPNPASGQATVRFAVSESAPVRVVVYDVMGRAVRTLYDGTPSADQTQALTLKGEDLPSGLYLIRLESALGSKTRQVTLLR